jgi:glycosyltransferase involved in cell wall biosynthesis
MHGGHVTLAPLIAEAVGERGDFDLVLASSMTNVPGLLGLARRSLGDVPVALYMHENQLTFPLSPNHQEDLAYAMVNWTSMIAADLVVFNSEYHRRVWFEALPGFLERFPDQRHTGLIDDVSARCAVRPVGCDLRPLDDIDRVRGERPLVLWNQRWEYDKGPAEFVAAMRVLVDDGLEFDVALAGDRAAEPAPELVELRGLLGDRLVCDGYADLDDYRRLLRRADVVVSTAHHEFFGIAVTEAIYAGAFPILPNRVVYPERIPEEHHAACLYDTEADLSERVRRAISDRAWTRDIAVRISPEMSAFDWSVVAQRYDQTMAALVA